MSKGRGLRVEFESFPGVELAIESLSREQQGIELFNVREVNKKDGTIAMQATVLCPEGKLNHFEKLIEDYEKERVDAIGRRRDNQN